MPQKILILICIGLIIASLGSCDNSGMEIGDNWVHPSTRVVIIDTCTVNVSSVLLDSIPTSGGNYIFAGRYRSDNWGETKTSTYITFKKTTDYTYNPDVKVRAVLDSMMLILQPDSMLLGDTTKLMRLNVHRIREEVELNDEGYLYGHSSFAYDAEPFHVESYYPKPRRGRELEIRLPDEMGKEFLEKLVNHDEDMETDEDFRKYFRGIVLRGDDSSEALLAFKADKDSLCRMVIYYHTIGEDRLEHEATFFPERHLLFTQVESDRTGTPLEGITFIDNEISSFNSNNLAFMEGLTGIYTKIEFPHLNRIRELGDHGAIVSATLRIYPLAGSFERLNYSELPQKLQLYTSNEKNVTTGSITDSNDQMQTGSLHYDEQLPDETYYTYDVTEFIKDQVGKIGVNKLHLQMIGENYGYTLRNMVVGNQTVGDKNIHLYIKYALYDE